MIEKTIVLVGTFDTKGKESLYLKNLIEKNGYQVITIDMGTGAGGKLVFSPDYPREEVIKAAESNMEEILSLGERGEENRIMGIMANGATEICQQLYQAGRLDGIISLGGTMGTNLGTKVMRTLPFGVPKVMLSTVASGDTSPFISTKDIVMVPSIADIAGLNRITQVTLTEAAGAVMGMVAVGRLKSREKRVIGITTLGGTTCTAVQVKNRLEERGYEVVIFHTSGGGGRAMENLIEQDLIQGVFDLSTNEVVDHIYGGWTDAGATRLEAAGKKGIPQLIAPGNIDHIIYSSPDKIPKRFKHQRYHLHGPSIYVLRTKKNEIVEVAKVMAEKLNKARGPTAVILPLKGLSISDKLVKEFYDPEANLTFFDILSKNLKPEIETKEVNAHITDSLFAEEAAEMLYKLMKFQTA